MDKPTLKGLVTIETEQEDGPLTMGQCQYEDGRGGIWWRGPFTRSIEALHVILEPFTGDDRAYLAFRIREPA
jgi:hypothetical protein